MDTKPADAWGKKRVAAFAILGLLSRIFMNFTDFLPMGKEEGVRDLFFWMIPLHLVFLLGLVLFCLIWAVVDLCRLHFRKLASSLLALAMLPLFIRYIGSAPVFDPWFWYVFVNQSKLESVASQPNAPRTQEKYVILGSYDTTIGLASSDNTFIDLIYIDKAAERPPSEKEQRLYGNFYIRHTYFP